MNRFKVLAIAPYAGMRDLMLDIAASRNDVDVVVFQRDREDALETIRQHANSSVDVIISRGGTAEMISAVSTIPVVEVKLSGFDLVRVFQMLEYYTGRFAIVGFPNISGAAQLFCELQQYKCDIYMVENTQEMIAQVERCRNDGYNLIVGDAGAVHLAETVGLKGILITSGRESIQEAFDQAVVICTCRWEQQQRCRYIQTVVSSSEVDFMCFTEQRQIEYSSFALTDPGYEAARELLFPLVHPVLKEGSIRQLQSSGQYTWLVRGWVVPYKHRRTACFSLIPFQTLTLDNEPGVTVYNPADLAANFSAYNSKRREEAAERAKKYGRSALPVFVLGETGTDQDSFVQLIHRSSIRANNSMIAVDGQMISEERWSSLFHSQCGLLTQERFTFYFKNIDALSKEQHEDLLGYLDQMVSKRQNRFLFSCFGSSVSALNSRVSQYVGRYSCISLVVPPLRDCRESIANVASIYISEWNVENGRQIVGLEKEALALAEDYSWPGNLEQLKRVLRELAVNTKCAYISLEEMRRILEMEEDGGDARRQGTLDLGNPLDQIEQDILNLVLQQENMNQSRAAKRLGISRTTFWRKLRRQSP